MQTILHLLQLFELLFFTGYFMQFFDLYFQCEVLIDQLFLFFHQLTHFFLHSLYLSLLLDLFLFSAVESLQNLSSLW